MFERSDRSFFPGCCLSLMLLIAACAPSDQKSPVEHIAESGDSQISIGSWTTIHSDVFDEDRQLAIHLPDEYETEPDRRYPLFVLLDGRHNFKATASMIHALSRGGAIPHMIVGGIDSPNRWRDLTPVEGMGIPGTGGGELFKMSLAEEILPHIDATYRTNGFRVFSGHSLGGLTTMNTLFEQPELFDAYLALSPSLEWDDGFMLDRARRFLARPDLPDAMLYMALADERLERQYYDPMVELLEESAPPQLVWTSQLFEEQDDHMSIRVTAGLAGVRWVFRDWRLGSHRIYAMSSEEIEAHYAMATVRYKEPRELGMMEITDAGYWGLYDEATVDPAMEFFRLAVEKWPDAAYPYSCLGEGLERTGDLEAALEQMERALRMAEQTDDRDLAYYQGMVDRVTAALED